MITMVSTKGDLHLFPLQDNAQTQPGDTVISYRPPEDKNPATVSKEDPAHE